jgi:hypothetical protein
VKGIQQKEMKAAINKYKADEVRSGTDVKYAPLLRKLKVI